MDKINIKDIAKCRLETMYNTTCMAIKMNGTKKVNGDTLSGCIAIGKKGSENLQTAVVQDVGGVPVFGQCGAPQDPHCHDDHYV